MSKVESVSRAFGAPMRYIQGPGEFDNLENYTHVYGSKVCIVIDGFLFEDFKKRLDKIFQNSKSTFEAVKFCGECSRAEIERVLEIAKKACADVIVGVGGGKTLDTIKAASDSLNLPRIIVPTSASSDAPTSSISIIYSPEGVHEGAIKHKRGTDLVLMDSSIISKAPVRLFVAGMGDAIATMFEANANKQSDSPNFIGKGYRSCKMSIAIANLCFDMILKDGVKAKRDIENGLCTEAVENIIEANTLLSGLGFENTGCCTAHGIHAGLSEIPESHNILHGEKVAFGVICQMILENASDDLIDKVMNFFISVGLPVTLHDVNVEPTSENIRIITEKVYNKNPYVHNEPFKVTFEQVQDAILAADALGFLYKNK